MERRDDHQGEAEAAAEDNVRGHDDEARDRGAVGAEDGVLRQGAEGGVAVVAEARGEEEGGERGDVRLRRVELPEALRRGHLEALRPGPPEPHAPERVVAVQFEVAVGHAALELRLEQLSPVGDVRHRWQLVGPVLEQEGLERLGNKRAARRRSEKEGGGATAALPRAAVSEPGRARPSRLGI